MDTRKLKVWVWVLPKKGGGPLRVPWEILHTLGFRVQGLGSRVQLYFGSMNYVWNRALHWTQVKRMIILQLQVRWAATKKRVRKRDRETYYHIIKQDL